MISLGFWLLTVHPIERQVPKTCFTVPTKSLDNDFYSINLAILITCIKWRFPSCFYFLTFPRYLELLLNY